MAAACIVGMSWMRARGGEPTHKATLNFSET
jgi:hypothetical protein